jgi:hypothetical protein
MLLVKLLNRNHQVLRSPTVMAAKRGCRSIQQSSSAHSAQNASRERTICVRTCEHIRLPTNILSNALFVARHTPVSRTESGTNLFIWGVRVPQEAPLKDLERQVIKLKSISTQKGAYEALRGLNLDPRPSNWPICDTYTMKHFHKKIGALCKRQAAKFIRHD